MPRFQFIVRKWQLPNFCGFYREQMISSLIEKYDITFGKAADNSYLGPKGMAFACP
jgi:hypothetical protein